MSYITNRDISKIPKDQKIDAEASLIDLKKIIPNDSIILDSFVDTYISDSGASINQLTTLLNAIGGTESMRILPLLPNFYSMQQNFGFMDERGFLISEVIDIASSDRTCKLVSDYIVKRLKFNLNFTSLGYGPLHSALGQQQAETFMVEALAIDIASVQHLQEIPLLVDLPVRTFKEPLKISPELRDPRKYLIDERVVPIYKRLLGYDIVFDPTMPKVSYDKVSELVFNLLSRVEKLWEKESKKRLSDEYFKFKEKCLKVTSEPFTRMRILLLLFMGCVERHPGPKGKKKGGKKRPMRKGRKGGQKQEDRIAKASTYGRGFLLYRGIGMPDNLTTRLRYVIPLQIVTGGGLVNSLRFSTNAYDVDSALASTAMAYFSELAAIYGYFRTIAMHYNFQVMNPEGVIPVNVVHGFSRTSFSATALGANYGENPYIYSKMMNWKGGLSELILRQGRTVATIAGTKQAIYDDLYTGSTSSSTLATNGTIYCYIGGVWG